MDQRANGVEIQTATALAFCGDACKGLDRDAHFFGRSKPVTDSLHIFKKCRDVPHDAVAATELMIVEITYICSIEHMRANIAFGNIRVAPTRHGRPALASVYAFCIATSVTTVRCVCCAADNHFV